MSDPVIEVVNLSKAFGPKVVLSNVNLSVEMGESLVVLGGSGTGKTVLLRNIMGLLVPDHGHVKVEGRIVHEMSHEELFETRKKIGMCFQMAALFDSLRLVGIAHVTVRFDGYGDSGQIEDIEVLAGEEAIALPTTTVEIAMLDYHQEVPEILSQPLRDAIETLSYAFLQETHAGWENNEGGYGDFLFDVAAGTITLDYNERIETSENYSHEF